MCELTTRFIDDTYREYYNMGKHKLAQIYLKSEADKVIAEKDKELRRHKYKRCLAMARWCKRNRLYACVCGPVEKIDFWEKWHKRWLELAEKFKPNNSTAQQDHFLKWVTIHRPQTYNKLVREYHDFCKDNPEKANL